MFRTYASRGWQVQCHTPNDPLPRSIVVLLPLLHRLLRRATTSHVRPAAGPPAMVIMMACSRPPEDF